MDLLLGTKDQGRDIVFVNGQCPVTRNIAEGLAQRLTIRLRTFWQEWFLNTDYGVPYLESILGHKNKKSFVDIIIQEQIYSERGVAQITQFDSTLNGNTRTYSCTFKVRSTSGEETSTITI